MNMDHTFFWLRAGDAEKFHNLLLPYYMNEEALVKGVFSWPIVKIIQKASGISYQMAPISQREFLVNTNVPSSNTTSNRQCTPPDSDSDTEEETLPKLSLVLP
jgi:hypothetical protein